MQDESSNWSAGVPNAEAFELFLSGEDTLWQLQGFETLNALVAAVDEMAQRGDEGLARLLDVVVTAVARDAESYGEEYTPLTAAYGAYRKEMDNRPWVKSDREGR
jgi:hypothetical protein